MHVHDCFMQINKNIYFYIPIWDIYKIIVEEELYGF